MYVRETKNAENAIGFWTYIEHAAKTAKKFGDCLAQSQQIDVDKAVRLNHRFAHRYGWKAHTEDIEKALGHKKKKGSAAFAIRVAFWQCKNGLKVDGIIGPQTWHRIQEAIGARRYPIAIEPMKDISTKPQGPFGTLTVLSPPLYRFKYTFMPDDALWLARLVKGEAGGEDDLDNHAVIWSVFNRFALFTHSGSYWMKRAGYRGYKTFAMFVQSYSTTLQPVLRSVQAAKRAIGYAKKNPQKFKYIKTGGYYPNTTVPKGQLEHHLKKIQKMTWSRFKPETRSMIERAIRGQLDNPIGIASEFNNTRDYFRRKRGRNPSPEEWIEYTLNFARRKKLIWVGSIKGLHQMKSNAFYIDNRVKHLPPSTVRVILLH